MFVLVKALPHVDNVTNNVLAWELEGKYSGSNRLGEFQKSYAFIYNCAIEGPLKPLENWTKSEIEALYPEKVFEKTFYRAKDRAETPSEVIIKDDFDINSL
tara:strand:+ start:70 stop:372 length:303 start_codon:yes stop_codon:yes gene_type:complete